MGVSVEETDKLDVRETVGESGISCSCGREEKLVMQSITRHLAGTGRVEVGEKVEVGMEDDKSWSRVEERRVRREERWRVV